MSASASGTASPHRPFQQLTIDEDGSLTDLVPTRRFGLLRAFQKPEHESEFRGKLYLLCTGLHVLVLSSYIIVFESSMLYSLTVLAFGSGFHASDYSTLGMIMCDVAFVVARLLIARWSDLVRAQHIGVRVWACYAIVTSVVTMTLPSQEAVKDDLSQTYIIYGAYTLSVMHGLHGLSVPLFLGTSALWTAWLLSLALVWGSIAGLGATSFWLKCVVLPFILGLVAAVMLEQGMRAAFAEETRARAMLCAVEQRTASLSREKERLDYERKMLEHRLAEYVGKLQRPAAGQARSETTSQGSVCSELPDELQLDAATVDRWPAASSSHEGALLAPLDRPSALTPQLRAPPPMEAGGDLNAPPPAQPDMALFEQRLAALDRALEGMKPHSLDGSDSDT